MSKVVKSITELIGNTPMLELTGIEESHSLEASVIAKLEYFNPCGSVKDRVAKNMIENAEKNGDLKPGSVIIEPTSGNTGIGLASVGVSKGYRVIITMPETMSAERRNLMKAYGAELVLTEGSKGMNGAIAKAEELAKEIPGAFIPGQFSNPSNPQAHFETTGPEIWEQTGGNVDILVSGVGTGGTIGGEPGPHKIQGIGAGFVPEILNTEIYDEIVTVADSDAYQTGRELAKTEGLLVGISSGAAVWAAVQAAKREENKGKTIVAVLPDTGERYLSTPMFTQA